MQQQAKRKNFPYPYLHYETQDIAKAYGAIRITHFNNVQKQQNGRFKVAYIGTIDDNYLEPERVQKKTR